MLLSKTRVCQFHCPLKVPFRGRKGFKNDKQRPELYWINMDNIN